MLRVYNTLTRTKEPFEPVRPGKVGIYLCGPTVYKPSHIGHMVGPVIFDAIKRYLAYSRLSGDAGGQHHRRGRQADRRVEQARHAHGATGGRDDGRLHEQPRGPGRRRDRPLPALHRDDGRDHRVHADAGREGLRLRSPGRRVFRGGQVPRLRQAEPSRRRGHAGRGRRHGRAEAGRRRFRPVEVGQAGRAVVAQPVGTRAGPAGTSNAPP